MLAHFSELSNFFSVFGLNFYYQNISLLPFCCLMASILFFFQMMGLILFFIYLQKENVFSFEFVEHDEKI